jgi:hypothetical protein
MLSVIRLAKNVAAKLWPPVAALGQQAQVWVRSRPRLTAWTGGTAAVLGLVVILVATERTTVWSWVQDKETREAITPLLTFAAALAAGLFAVIRHFQTIGADRQRRITESFSRAVGQLGSDKIEERLGGIYTLERISRESPNDYWTVMETRS